VSFWSVLGDVADTARRIGNPLVAAFDTAKVAAATTEPGDTEGDMAKKVGSAFFKDAISPLNTAPVQNILEPIAWAGNQASHALSAGWNVGDIAVSHGGSQLTPLHSAEAWKNAWDETAGISFGQAAVGSVNEAIHGSGPVSESGMFGDTPEALAARRRFDILQEGIGGKVSSGAVDILSTWYADPTMGVGKAVKVARAGSRIADAADANKVAEAVSKISESRTAGQKAAGKFSNSADETASRLYDHVAQTDNMDYDQIAAHFKHNLERSGDSAPLVGIMGQAGKIADLDLQRKVKADVLLTGAGSDAARRRLIENAPHIARAVQRVASAPEGFKIVDDMVASGLSGRSLMNAVDQWASTANKAELEAYAKDLDNIHTRIASVSDVGRRGGVEQIGGSTLGAVKSKYRAGMAREMYFQPGPASRTVRVLHWATGQRMRGVLAVDDAVRGHDELMDVLTRSKLFSAGERQRISDRWWSAPTQEQRAEVAHWLPEAMLTKLAAKHFDGDRKMLNDTLGKFADWRSSARTYTTRQMEEARVANKSRVVMEDPLTGTPTSIDRALLETHIANNVAIPDVSVMERIIRHAKDAGTAGDKFAASGEWALKTAEDANDVWRTFTLMRPGYVLRTQLDTQARAALTVGATAVVRNAAKGLGHKIGDKLNGQQVDDVEAMASDLLRQDGLRREATALRQQASGMVGDAGQRMLDRADALEAEAAKAVTYKAPARRIATEQRTLNIKGQKVSTRAAASEEDLKGLARSLHTGDSNLSDAILRVESKFKVALQENPNSWVTTMPDDVRWTAAYLRSTHSLVGSKAGRAILKALDEPNVDMVRHLRNSPEVKAAWREVRNGNPEFDSWLDRAISQTEWTAPTPEIRATLLSGKSLSPADVDKMFKPAFVPEDAAAQFDALPDRMPVHAPELDVINPAVSKIGSAMDAAKKMVQLMSDQPDTVLGRIPFYTERYFGHYKDLAAREIDRTGELGLEARARIEKVARHRAIEDTKQTMYDTARFTGAHDRVARMGFAFLGAWEDSMRAWGRMFYDDPARVGKVAKVWYAPERGGLVTDENGNPVRPGQNAREKWIALPIDWIPGVDVKEFKFRKDSFNTVFQGSVPWFPGFGPVIQVPVKQIAAKAFPEIADPNFEVGGVKVGQTPLLRSMFDMGLPKTGATAGEGATSFAGQFVPGWMKRLRDVATGDSQQFNDAYAMALNDELGKARQAGKNPSSKEVMAAADAKARKTARSMMFLEFVSTWGLGISGEGATKADFYRQQYQSLVSNADELAKKGTTPMKEMARLHPEVAGLDWSFSENKTGINASLKVENRVRKYGTDIQKNPEFGWFYVGSDNVGGQFSAASYDAQFGREAAPGSGETWRSKMNSAQIKEKTAADLGWNDYYKLKDEVDQELMARGLHSLSQKGAEDLNSVMQDFKAGLADENPDWWKDFNSFDSTKVDRFLTQVAAPAMKDRRMSGRSDIKMMAQYLDLRKQAQQVAEQGGYSLDSAQGRDLRAVLLDEGNRMAQENIGFSQMWQRILQREVDVAMDKFPAESFNTSGSSGAFRF
jgi:hypothetical protein